jgi:acetoin utilization protein AcuB
MHVGSIATHCDQSIASAKELMAENAIHHLPVLQSGVPVGVLSEREILLFESLRVAPAADTPVDRIMKRDPLTAHADDALAEVAQRMVDARVDVAVVTEHNKVVGVFTAVDACRALADLARS